MTNNKWQTTNNEQWTANKEQRMVNTCILTQEKWFQQLSFWFCIFFHLVIFHIPPTNDERLTTNNRKEQVVFFFICSNFDRWDTSNAIFYILFLTIFILTFTLSLFSRVHNRLICTWRFRNTIQVVLFYIHSNFDRWDTLISITCNVRYNLPLF